MEIFVLELCNGRHKGEQNPMFCDNQDPTYGFYVYTFSLFPSKNPKSTYLCLKTISSYINVTCLYKLIGIVFIRNVFR